MSVKKKVRYDGKTYDSIKDMLDAYGCSRAYYSKCKKRGWSLKKTIDSYIAYKKHEDESTIDHLGNKYPSVKAMCEVYAIDESVYLARIKNGWDKESALTEKVGRVNKRICYKGIYYRSLNSLFEAYGLTNRTLFYDRKRAGWTLEQILETPVAKGGLNNICYDHTGRKFYSVSDMCEYWEVDVNSYKYHRRLGFSVEQCLNEEFVHDHLGKGFKNLKELCLHYNISYDKFLEKKNKSKWTVQQTTEYFFKEMHIGLKFKKSVRKAA